MRNFLCRAQEFQKHLSNMLRAQPRFAVWLIGDRCVVETCHQYHAFLTIIDSLGRFRLDDFFYKDEGNTLVLSGCILVAVYRKLFHSTVNFDVVKNGKAITASFMVDSSISSMGSEAP